MGFFWLLSQLGQHKWSNFTLWQKKPQNNMKKRSLAMHLKKLFCAVWDVSKVEMLSRLSEELKFELVYCWMIPVWWCSVFHHLLLIAILAKGPDFWSRPKAVGGVLGGIVNLIALWSTEMSLPFCGCTRVHDLFRYMCFQPTKMQTFINRL